MGARCTVVSVVGVWFFGVTPFRVSFLGVDISLIDSASRRPSCVGSFATTGVDGALMGELRICFRAVGEGSTACSCDSSSLLASLSGVLMLCLRDGLCDGVSRNGDLWSPSDGSAIALPGDDRGVVEPVCSIARDSTSAFSTKWTPERLVLAGEVDWRAFALEGSFFGECMTCFWKTGVNSFLGPESGTSVNRSWSFGVVSEQTLMETYFEE